MMPREGRTLLQQLEMDLKQGFTRIEVNREIVRIEDFLQQTAAEDKKTKHLSAGRSHDSR